MRIWLDQNRFESSSFSCRDNEGEMRICVEFRVADQAEAFARRFGGRANGRMVNEAAQSILDMDSETAVAG